MMRRTVILAAALGLGACASEPGASPADAGADGAVGDVAAPVDAATTVEIRFAAVVGAQPFSCSPAGGSFAGVGAPGSPWTPQDFRFYVHDVALVPQSGAPVPVALDQDGTWQYQNVALLDFEDRTGACSNGTQPTNDRVRGRVLAPAGTRWTGLRFRIGVPPSLNHANQATAPSPLNVSTLYWSWLTGYKFMRIDGRSGMNAFNFHLGATGCTGDPMMGTVNCTEANRPEVTLTGFDPAQNTVVADLARLLATTDVSRDMGGAPGCMSGATDPECGTTFATLGIGPASAVQTFFSVR